MMSTEHIPTPNAHSHTLKQRLIKQSHLDKFNYESSQF